MSRGSGHPQAAIPTGRYRTADQWWESLGRVPMNRILFDPLPGFATERDVDRLEEYEDRLCELVEGTLVEKTMGFEESVIAGRVIFLISGHVNLRKLGIVTSPDGMMRIRSDRIVIPDVAYISFAHLPNGRIPHEHIPSLVPDLAVEILSDGNTREEMAIKLREYMGAGTRLVWYVDPKTRSVDVHRASEEVVHLTGSDVVSGGEVLPEFETTLAAIFDGG